LSCSYVKMYQPDPNKAKSILKDLEVLTIYHFTLFPGFNGLASELKMRLEKNAGRS
jgi:hypothetical protein